MRQGSSPVYVFGETDPTVARQLHKTQIPEPSVFIGESSLRRNLVLGLSRPQALAPITAPLPSAPLPTPPSASAKEPAVPVPTIPRAAVPVSFASVMAEEQHRAPSTTAQHAYLQAVLRLQSTTRAIPHTATKMGDHFTAMKHASGNQRGRGDSYGDDIEGNPPVVHRTGGTISQNKAGSTGEAPGYATTASSNRPMLLSSRLPATGAATMPSKPPQLKGHSSSMDSVSRFPQAGALLRALSALSDEPERLTATPPSYLPASSPDNVLEAATLGSRPYDPTLVASVIKLSRLYSIAMSTADDIIFGAALERGPPYDRPLFLPWVKTHSPFNTVVSSNIAYMGGIGSGCRRFV
jgi:hypothetical protein